MVTNPLSVALGEPAINPGPRRMICAALAEVTSRGLHVRISIPGNEIAPRTFNPRLGVERFVHFGNNRTRAPSALLHCWIR
jgi:cobalt-precorrin-5B (C1)-methyltransferase